MLLSCQLIPKNVELSTETNMLANLVNIINILSVDDDFCLLEIVGIQNACKDINECCFTCSIVTQYRHEFIRLNFNSELIQSVHFFL